MCSWFLCRAPRPRLRLRWGHYATSSGLETALVAVDLEEDQASAAARFFDPKHATNTRADMPTQVKGETKLVYRQ